MPCWPFSHVESLLRIGVHTQNEKISYTCTYTDGAVRFAQNAASRILAVPTALGPAVTDHTKVDAKVETDKAPANSQETTVKTEGKVQAPVAPVPVPEKEPVEVPAAESKSGVVGDEKVPSRAPIQTETKKTPAAAVEETKKSVPEEKTAEKSPQTKTVYTSIIETVRGLTDGQIRAGCIYKLNKDHNLKIETGKKNSSFGVLVIVLIVIIASIVFLSSYYYKNGLIKDKQAPFSAPSWLPESLFPRMDNYYEHEMSRKLRDDIN